MKKLQLIIWILVLLFLSAHAGFLTIIVEKPFTPRNEYILMTVVGTIGTVLLVGAMAYFVYRWLKKNHSDLALKRAFQVYGFFVAAMILYSVFKLPEALETRNRYEYLAAFEPRFIELISEKLETGNGSSKTVKKHSNEVAHCVYCIFDFDENLTNKLRYSKDKRAFVFNNKEIKETIEMCLEIYKEK